jgi:prepilin signal peptidase PulO-like enzyme (type II secretory pathway)
MAVILSFYILGAYATTDMVRLLKGSSVAVNAPDCYCPVCKKKIKLLEQLPIISYVYGHGKCRNCKSAIPTTDIFLEVFLFAVMSMITILLDFGFTAFAYDIAVYEFTKVLLLFKYGKREENFTKNLCVSIVNNIGIFAIVFVLFLLAQIMK